MRITLCGWGLSNRPSILTAALLACFFGIVLPGLFLSHEIHRNRAYSLLYQVTKKIDQALPDAKNANISRPSNKKPSWKTDGYCNNITNSGHIAVVIKTGASELYSKLPAQLISLQCVSEPLIFSDLEQRLGIYQVHDVLSKVIPSVREIDPEFAIYHLQAEYAGSGHANDIPKLGNMPIISDDWRTEGKTAAWGLDKYKFLHMIERSWEMAPERDWYLYLEADTFLSWPNLLRWLETQDPQKALYFGRAIRMYEAPYAQPFFFGQGGAGIILSGATVYQFAVAKKGLAQRWDDRIGEMWFGDYILAAALHEELHLHITDMSSSMTEKDPTTIAFHQEMWCRPVITMHHIQPQLLDKLSRQDRQSNGSVKVFRDVYQEAFPLGFPNSRTDWDNTIEDPAVTFEILRFNFQVHQENASEEGEFLNTTQTFEDCEEACKQNDECKQFSFITLTALSTAEPGGNNTECHLSRAFMLGNAREFESGTDGEGSRKFWMSGWMTRRIEAWVNAHQRCAYEAEHSLSVHAE